MLRIHDNPYWDVSGDVCLQPGPTGITLLTADETTRFRLTPSLGPAVLADRRDPGRCVAR